MSIFWTKFRIFGAMQPVAWQRITFSFRNGWPSYFQNIFNNVVAEWVGGISAIHRFQLRNSGPNVANARIVQAQVVEQSPLLMQFLYGVTTLRDTWNVTAAPQSKEIRASERNSSRWSTKQLRFVNIFEIFEFSKFRCHGPPLLGNV